MRSLSDTEFNALSWKIIEWKVAYYAGQHVHKSRKADYEIDDHTYDAHEQRYLTLCRELGQPNTLVHKGYAGFEDLDHYEGIDGTKLYPMMEVDYSRPSVCLVISKLQTPKRKPRRKRK